MTEPQPNRCPRVGVSALVTDAHGRILLGHRWNVPLHGQWHFPGGKLEYGEGFFGCAWRELAEETGLNALEMELWPPVGTVIGGEHWIHIPARVTAYTGQPTNLEPDKCRELRWFHLQEPPDPMTLATAELLTALRKEAACG